MSSGVRHYEQDKESTIYVGNIDERCTDPLVWELMLQAGPVVNVHLPKDRVTRIHQGYGFVEFASEQDADYAIEIMTQMRLWGKAVRVNKASADKRALGPGGVPGEGGGLGVGAELFIGNLDPMVDEKVLFDTFSRFGPFVTAPKISRDDANLSKGYGFIGYASFDSSDDAVMHMHGQYLMNKEVTVQYAYKKDGKGERHGDAAERSLAAQGKLHGVQVDIPAMPAALVMPNGAPSAPAAMNGVVYPPTNGAGTPVAARAPQPPPSYNHGAYNYGAYNQGAYKQGAYSQGAYNQGAYNPGVYNQSNYGAMPPPPSGLPPQQVYGMPNRQYAQSPLQAPAQSPLQAPAQSPLQAPPSGAGLPARPPPPSMAGYGRPMNLPGMQQPPGMSSEDFHPPPAPKRVPPPRR